MVVVGIVDFTTTTSITTLSHTSISTEGKEGRVSLINSVILIFAYCLTKGPRARARSRLVIKIVNKLFYQNTKRLTDYKLLYQTLPNGHHHHNRKI